MINYLLLTKPGIIIGNLITLAMGFVLGSYRGIHFTLFAMTLLGLSCVMASACIFNNYIDRHLDQKMERTKKRAFVTGAVGKTEALTLAAILGIAGCLILYFTTNLLTLALAATGFFVYVILYSLWKAKTPKATAIGSIAGAVPPLVGYTAASGQLDMGALFLFLTLVFWQMPHFFSIALFRLSDYSKAGIPVLPVEKGVDRTKWHMIVYITLFMGSALLLARVQGQATALAAVVLLFGGAWLWLSLVGFRTKRIEQWGKQMFRLSLVVIMALSLTVIFQ